MTAAPGSAHENRARGLGLALLSTATFSTSGSFARSLINAGWSAEAAVAARVSVAALILAIPTLLALRGQVEVLRRHSRLILTYGVIVIAGGQICYFNAVERLSVGVALLLEYLGTILVVGWLWLRHGQRPRRLTMIGSVVALSGLVLVVNPTGAVRIDPVGVLWSLAAAVCLAMYYVLSAKGGEGLPPIVTVGAGMTLAAGTLILAALAGVLPIRATFGSVDFAGIEVSWLVPVLGLSVIAAVIGYVAGIASAPLLGAKLASFIGLTEVVFAVFFAWLLLGELPAGMQLVGGVLIVAGVVFVHVDELRSSDLPIDAIGRPEASDTATRRAA